MYTVLQDLFESLRQDRVQVSTQQSPELFRRGCNIRRVDRDQVWVSTRWRHHVRRSLRFRINNSSHEVNRRLLTRSRRMLPSKQDVEQNTESIDVGGDRDLLALQLLGSGIFRRKGIATDCECRP